MAMIVTCDQCGKRESARNDFDKPRQPVGWFVGLLPERVLVEACSRECVIALNDTRKAAGRPGLHWQQVEREDRLPADSAVRGIREVVSAGGADATVQRGR